MKFEWFHLPVKPSQEQATETSESSKGDEVEIMSETQEVIETQESIDELIDKNLSPALSLLEEIPGQQWSNRNKTILDLLSKVKKLQLIHGQVVASPSETVEDMKFVLLSDWQRYLDDQGLKRNDPVKRQIRFAQVVLDSYANYDRSIPEYKRDEKINLDEVAGFFDHNYFSFFDGDKKLSANELSLLLKSGFFDKIRFDKNNFYNFEKGAELVPEDFFIWLAEKKADHYILEYCLSKLSQKKQYSIEASRAMIRNGFDYLLIRFPDQFKEIDCDFLLDYYSISYPYQTKNLVAFIEQYFSNHSAKESKDEMMKKIFKHQLPGSGDDEFFKSFYSTGCPKEVAAAVQVIKDHKINFKNEIDDDMESLWPQVKCLLDQGYASFFNSNNTLIPHEFRQYLYNWLKKNHQSELVNSLVVNQTEYFDLSILSSEQIEAFFDRLITANHTSQIESLFKKGAINTTLSRSLFLKLKDKLPLSNYWHYFTGLDFDNDLNFLSKEFLAGNYKNEYNGINKEKSLFVNIDCLDLNNRPEMLEYQKLSNEIREYIGNAEIDKMFAQINYFDDSLNASRPVLIEKLKVIRDNLKLVATKAKEMYPEEKNPCLFLINQHGWPKILFQDKPEPVINFYNRLDCYNTALRNYPANIRDSVIGLIANLNQSQLDKLRDMQAKAVNALQSNSHSTFKEDLVLYSLILKKAVDFNFGLDNREYDFGEQSTRQFLDKIYDFCSTNYPEDRLNDLNEFFPWAKEFKKLHSIQGRSSNRAYDLWLNNLTPVLLQAHKAGLIKFESATDGQKVLEFVKRFGMVKSLGLFEVFIKISSYETVEDLLDQSANLVSLLELDPIKLKKSNNWKSLIFQALEGFSYKIQTAIINDDGGYINNKLDFELTKEIIDGSIGKSGFGHGTDPVTAIKTYIATQAVKPEKFLLNPAYQREMISVPALKEVGLDQTQEQEKIINNPDLQRVLNDYTDIFINLNRSDKDYFQSIIDDLRGFYTLELTSIEAQLTDEKKSATANSKKIKGLEIRLNNRQQSLESIDILGDLLKSEKGLTEKIIALAEQTPDDWPGKKAALRVLTQKDFGQRFSEAGQKFQEIQNQDKLRQIFGFNDYIGQYFIEHYLNRKHNQNQGAIEIANKKVLKQIEVAWSANDYQKSILKISADKLDDIFIGKVSNKNKEITLIPSKGFLRVFSGDLGGACTSSQNLKLAQGEFDGIVSYALVMNEGTPDQKFVGSFLVIETKTENNEPCLVLRANNPAENLSNQVDVEVLVEKIIGLVKDLAKKMGIKKCLVPFDNASQSCSNRAFVANYYKKNFADREKVGLINCPETNFNNYPIWNKNSNNPVVEI